MDKTMQFITVEEEERWKSRNGFRRWIPPAAGMPYPITLGRRDQQSVQLPQAAMFDSTKGETSMYYVRVDRSDDLTDDAVERYLSNFNGKLQLTRFSSHDSKVMVIGVKMRGKWCQDIDLQIKQQFASRKRSRPPSSDPGPDRYRHIRVAYDALNATRRMVERHDYKLLHSIETYDTHPRGILYDMPYIKMHIGDAHHLLRSLRNPDTSATPELGLFQDMRTTYTSFFNRLYAHAESMKLWKGQQPSVLKQEYDSMDTGEEAAAAAAADAAPTAHESLVLTIVDFGLRACVNIFDIDILEMGVDMDDERDEFRASVKPLFLSTSSVRWCETMENTLWPQLRERSGSIKPNGSTKHTAATAPW